VFQEAPEADEHGEGTMNDEPPEQRPPGEPIRCRHCGEVDPDDHDDGCPQQRAEELADVPPEAAQRDQSGMIIPEHDGDGDGDAAG